MPKKIIFKEEQIKEIINFYTINKFSCKEIGKFYNCSKQTINTVLKNNNIIIRDSSHCQQKYEIDERIFQNIDCHEKAYWLGMLFGDGCISDKGEVILSLQIKDEIYIEKYKNFLKSTHPIKTEVATKLKKNGQKSICKGIRISNKALVHDLEIYGIKPRKTYHMTFPNLPDEFLSSFMLGLVDSDGCFCVKNYKNKTSLNFSFIGPITFAEEFQKKLINKCKVSKTKLEKQKNTSFIRVVNYGGFKHIFSIVKFLYSGNSTFFERKKRVAIEFLLTKFPKDPWLLENKC